jgi:endoglucanase
MRDQSLQFLREPVQTPSPSGHEHRVARVYRSYCEPLADTVTADLHGNVIAAINPDADFLPR